MKRLEEIKEEYAKEKGFEGYDELLLQNTHSFGDLDDIINEICLRYSKECMKKMAANIQVYLFNCEDLDGKYSISSSMIDSIDTEDYIKLL